MGKIPADVVGQAGATAATATQNAANLTQAPQAKWHDVWTQTGSGLLSPPAVSPFIPKPGEAMTPEVAKRIEQARASAAEMGSTNLGGLADGMSQQAGVVADQAAQLWNGKLPDGQSMSTLQRVGAAFGMLSSIEQLITMPLGAIPFPAFPALRVTDMDVGLPHAHMHPPNLIPPNPVPVPLPSTGPVIPIPFVSGASKTLINMMPAARCGDMGLGVFCGGFFPMYEVFMGSANVWIEGSRAGRLGVDVTKHCIFSAPKPSDPPVGPMFGATIMGSANVMIGGVPLPSLSSMAIGAAFKAAFKGVGKLLGAARKKLGKARPPTYRTGRGPGLDPRLSGRPLYKLGDGAYDVNKVINFIKALPEGSPINRMVLPRGSKVSVQELRQLTSRTKLEWAVVLDENGRLVVIRGEADQIVPRSNDIMLAHTHPDDSANLATDISDGDLRGAQGQAAAGNPSSMVAVTSDGNVHAFDKNGVQSNPTHTPVGPGGDIDGRYYDPQTGEMDSQPPRFDNDPP